MSDEPSPHVNEPVNIPWSGSRPWVPPTRDQPGISFMLHRSRCIAAFRQFKEENPDFVVHETQELIAQAQLCHFCPVRTRSETGDEYVKRCIEVFVAVHGTYRRFSETDQQVHQSFASDPPASAPAPAEDDRHYPLSLEPLMPYRVGRGLEVNPTNSLLCYTPMAVPKFDFSSGRSSLSFGCLDDTGVAIRRIQIQEDQIADDFYRLLQIHWENENFHRQCHWTALLAFVFQTTFIKETFPPAEERTAVFRCNPGQFYYTDTQSVLIPQFRMNMMISSAMVSGTQPTKYPLINQMLSMPDSLMWLPALRWLFPWTYLTAKEFRQHIPPAMTETAKRVALLHLIRDFMVKGQQSQALRNTCCIFAITAFNLQNSNHQT